MVLKSILKTSEKASKAPAAMLNGDVDLDALHGLVGGRVAGAREQDLSQELAAGYTIVDDMGEVATTDTAAKQTTNNVKNSDDDFPTQGFKELFGDADNADGKAAKESGKVSKASKPIGSDTVAVAGEAVKAGWETLKKSVSPEKINFKGAQEVGHKTVDAFAKKLADAGKEKGGVEGTLASVAGKVMEKANDAAKGLAGSVASTLDKVAADALKGGSDALKDGAKTLTDEIKKLDPKDFKSFDDVQQKIGDAVQKTSGKLMENGAQAGGVGGFVVKAAGKGLEIINKVTNYLSVPVVKMMSNFFKGR